MAVEIKVKFPLKIFGTSNTAAKDDWYDVGSIAAIPANSPIAVGKQLQIGFINVGSQDKALDFELRVNKATKSAGNTTDTDLIAATASDPSAGSKWEDLDQDGRILTVAPISTVSCTGVEKLWLRVQSGSNVVSSFDWWIYYEVLE
jgi:hypothetical protein